MIAEPKPPAPIKKSIITLTTDYGTSDYYVGAMKGAITEVNPNVAIIDLTHDIPPYDLLAAAFALRAAYYDFPLHTIHVAVVDPGNGPKRRPILVKTENYYFIGPDNGIFSFIYGCERIVGVWSMSATHYFRKKVNPTFTGRDIYAPAAAYLAKIMSAEDFGEPINDFARIPLPTPEAAGNKMKGIVLLSDRFGNLITNIEYAELAGFIQQHGFKRFQLGIGGKVAGPISRTIGEGQGDFFVIPGSSGYLEIVAKQKSATELLGAKRGQEVFLQFE